VSHLDIVTGGAGFLGSHLVDRLSQQDREVIIVDNLDAGVKENLCPSKPNVRLLEADTREVAWHHQIPNEVARIFHLAANASVPRSYQDPTYDLTTNIQGTLNMLELAKKTKATFIFISSAAVYGTPQYVPTDESHPTTPISHYGVSKLAGEFYTELYRREFNLSTRIIRYFNCYGPRQPRYAIFDFLTKALSMDNTFEVLGSGEQLRTQLYVEDAVTATLLVAERGTHYPYNIGSEKSFPVLELAQKVLTVSGQTHKSIVKTGQSWPGDIQALIPNTNRLKALGFEQTVSLEEGLRRVYEWWTTRTK
jgi:UDP-glucose 4-epimerase